ncbi:MAG: OmpA family protein [Microscillaceae bacterium]|nr:OmpA family protein [Microscillaceae bacterium]
MKRFLFLGILLSLSFISLAQTSKLDLANAAYEKFHYQEAIQWYEELLREDPRNDEVEEKLAHSYRKINDSRNAEKWYAKIVQYERTSSQNKLYYAQSLAKNGRYEEARRWYKIYAREARNDKRGAEFGKSYEDTSHFHQDAARYQIALAPFNSKQADFSPMYYQGGIIFCSNRDSKKAPFQLKFNWNNTNFLDLFYVKGRVGTPEYFHEKVNSKYHEGPVAFFNADRSMIFTRNNYIQGKFGQSSDGINKLKLYEAEMVSGQWDNIREFPYNDDEYSVGHPAISTDGNTLYFASDMPGGLGGTDIYQCNYENGRWGTPKNLGSIINTAGNEMFPFIDASGNLYFASDGHPGLGGLDVFLAQSQRGKFAQPQNIGVPINSSQDDFGFIIDIDRGDGYFSSNREGGVGDDDIYTFQTQTCDVIFVVVDSTQNTLIKEARIQITEMYDNQEVVYINENDSVYSIRTSFRTGYVFKVSKEGYQEGRLKLTEKDLLNCERYAQGGGDTLKIYLNPPALLTQNSKIPQNPNRRDTDKNTTLGLNPESNLPPMYQRRGFDPSKVYKIDNIYYDLDKYYIRPDAVITLNQILTILYQNPQMRLLLSSHTDSRADYDYNIRLSQRRSNAAYRYLINRGISPDRLEIDYFGETRLITPCPDGASCSEDQHQLNRRTELIILSE